MKKKKILAIVISILLFIEGISLFLTYKSYNNMQKHILEDVETIDVFKNKNKAISIMVQNPNNEEQWDEYDDRSKWPDPKTHGFVGAECTDSEGKEEKWEDVLTFSLTDKTATIKTKQTSYCTLYFAKGEPALDHLNAKGGTTFAGGNGHTTVVDGMYRYKGTSAQVTNNYICFGTTVASTCTSNKDKYMYRIIGITSQEDTKINLYANQLKIIKATPSNTSQAWSNNSDIKWGSSSVKTYLNGTSSNQFLYTITSLPDGEYWKSMISQHGWYIKDQTSINTTEPQNETLSGDANNRIGLMYATDYKNSGDSNTNNWLHITHGTSDSSKYSSNYEWTMTRYGNYRGDYFAWRVYTDGRLDIPSVNNTFAVRPVFYLTPDIRLSGEGTESNPFTIS